MVLSGLGLKARLIPAQGESGSPAGAFARGGEKPWVKDAIDVRALKARPIDVPTCNHTIERKALSLQSANHDAPAASWYFGAP